MNGEQAVPTDEDGGLVAAFLRGDATAFDSLFQKYQDYVYHIIYGIVGSAEESRDLTQEVFVQVYRSLPRFRQNSRFATWLYRIAMNRAVDAARGSRRWRFLPFSDEPSLAHRTTEANEEPEAAFERQLGRDQVQAVLQKCSIQHRQVLALKYYQDLSIEEIAAIAECSLSAAKVRLHRARQAFRCQYVALYGSPAGNTEAEGEEAHAAQTTGK